MASKDIQAKIQVTIDDANAAQSLGQLKKSLLELQELQAQFGDQSGPGFDKLNTAVSNTSGRLAELRDGIGDIRDRVSTLEGTPVERLSNSFGLLKESIFSLDFDKAKIGAEGLLSSLTPVQDGKLVTGFSGIGGAVKNLGGTIGNLGKTFATVGKALLTNPIFLLAAIIVAVVVAVGKLLDSLGLLKPILDAIKAAIGFVVDAFKALTDWLGLTNNAEEEYAEATKKREEARSEQIEKAGKQRLELFNLTKDLTEEEIKLLEEKLGVQIDSATNEFDIQKKTLEQQQESIVRRVAALNQLKEAAGELSEEQEEDLKKLTASYKDNANQQVNIEIQKQNAIRELNQKTLKSLRDIIAANISDENERSKAQLKIREEDAIAQINADIKRARGLGQSTKDLERLKAETVKFYVGEVEKVNDRAEKQADDKRKENFEKFKANIAKELKSIQDAEAAKVSLTEEGSAARLQAQINEINRVEKFQKDNAKNLGISQNQLTKIIQDNNDKKLALQTEFDNKIIAAENKKNITLKEINVLQATNDKERLEAQISLIEEQSKIELQNKNLTAEEITKIELNTANEIKEIRSSIKEIDDKKHIEDLENISSKKERELDALNFDLENSELSFKNRKLKIEEIKNASITAAEAERDAKIAAANGSNESIEQANEEFRQRELQAQKEYEENTTRINKEEVDKRAQQATAGINAVQNLSDAIFNIKMSRLEKGSAEEQKAAKKQFEINKKLQIAQAVIQGVQAVLAAYSSGSAIPVVGAVTGPLFAALAAVTAAGNIAKIKSATFESSSGGGNTGSGSSGAPSVGGGGNSFQPGQFFGLGQGQPQQSNTNQPPLRVFVTETDITNTQRNVSNIETRARVM